MTADNVTMFNVAATLILPIALYFGALIAGVENVGRNVAAKGGGRRG